ncbi:MAG TPA: glycosyltransferase family 2 protein [Candidatus Dormibacteraeota bacterium]|nr:glycosyltransferase family 2 protein [Candidatus Dormibacteraeota bacterium]
MTVALVAPRISIVMPCLNEADTVGVCVSKAFAWLRSSGVAGEVLVVDNGSTDRSSELATAAGARVIRERRRGYGNAYLRGFAEARGEIIVMGDADDTYDFSRLDDLIRPLEQGYDLVLGNRFSGGVERGAMPWAHRYIGSPIINLLIRRFIGVRVGDSQSGFRAFTRGAYQRLALRSGGMELASEMIVNAAREGLQITEVPAPYTVRLGESKLNTVRDGWRHLRFLLISAPNFLFVLPGLALLGMGIVVTAISFLAAAGVEIGSLAWQPVFAGSILISIGANALVFGAITKSYGVDRGILKEDAWSRFYRRVFSLERVLAIGGVLLFAGLVLNLGLFTVWAGGARLPFGLQLAALAQSLMIVGANLGMAGFLAMAIADRR